MFGQAWKLADPVGGFTMSLIYRDTNIGVEIHLIGDLGGLS